MNHTNKKLFPLRLRKQLFCGVIEGLFRLFGDLWLPDTGHHQHGGGEQQKAEYEGQATVQAGKQPCQITEGGGLIMLLK